MYADTTDFTFAEIPEDLGTDRFTFIRTVGVDCYSDFPDALSFTAMKPVRLYVGFRDDQRLPDWVDTEYLTTPYRVKVDSRLRILTYVMYESKKIFIPAEGVCIIAYDVFISLLCVTL